MSVLVADLPRSFPTQDLDDEQRAGTVTAAVLLGALALEFIGILLFLWIF